MSLCPYLHGFPFGFIEENWAEFRKKCFLEVAGERYRRLLTGLDGLSIATVNMYLDRLTLLPYQPWRYNACCDYDALLHVFITDWDRTELARIRQFDYEAHRRQFGIPEHMKPVIPVNCYHNGLTLLNSRTLEYLKGKDFIDGGGFMGESGFVFSAYSPRKVFCFEPLPEQSARIRENFSMAPHPEILEVVPCGLGEEDGQANLSAGAAGSTLNENLADTASGIPVEICRIDSFAASRELKLGLIKLDIEGLELEAVRGAEQTIRRDRPVLLVSIYHTVKDFFGVKAFLENLVPDYRFSIRHLDANEMLLEYMLIGIPGELAQ